MYFFKTAATLFLTLLLIFSGFMSSAQGINLSPQAQISLITVSPGAELYSMYGHSAIRIYDPLQGLDIVYNYGTFDFRTPNFYVKFVRGKLPYQLAPGYYESLKQSSMQDNRSVYEQILTLTAQDRAGVNAFLENNYLPQNRSYLYDFFYDNCATRIRDVFAKIINRNLQFPTQLTGEPLSFRQLVGIYQTPHPWVDLGVDLVMGLPSDKIANPTEKMFLPDYLMQGFKQSKVKTTGGSQAFVQREIPVFKATGPPAEKPFFTPVIFFWLLFTVVAGLTYLHFRKRKPRHGIDILLFSLAGILGFVLLFLWFGTDHRAFKDNLNLLWALPLHLPMAFFLFRKRKTKFIRIYFLVTSVVLILLMISWPVFPQEYHPAVFPILLTLAVRALYILSFSSKKKINNNPYR